MKNQFGTEEEVEELLKWASAHYETCSIKGQGAIGGRYTYSFTPTSIGTICMIKCACGQKFDATKYEWW